MSDIYDVGAAELKELAGKLNDLLRIRTLPIGMKQFETLEEMQQVSGLRMPAEAQIHDVPIGDAKPDGGFHNRRHRRKCPGSVELRRRDGH